VGGGGKTAAPPPDVEGGSVPGSCPSEIDTPEEKIEYFYIICKQFHLHFTSSVCADILAPKNYKAKL